MIRAFIAIPLSLSDRRLLQRASAPLAEVHNDHVRWLSLENWHLTVRFLGNVDDATQDVLIEAMRQTAQKVKKFKMIIRKIGGFPSLKSQIVAAHVDAHPTLDHLFVGLDEAAVISGLPQEDRSYKPHITLGKAAQPRRLAPIEIPPLVVEARELVFYESQPTDEGSRYRALKRFSFG